MSRLALLTTGFGLLAAWSVEAQAQSGTRAAGGGIANFQSIGSSVSSGFQGTTSPVASFSSSRPVSKPFQGLRTGAAVSPYINLFNISGDNVSTFDTYNTIVRPQLNQQAVNRSVNQRLRQQQQQQRQQQLLTNRRVQAISAQNGIPTQGSENIFPTGHATAFGAYLQYYPGLQRRR